ncbi:MAG: HD domain-containing protein [Flavobacteriales bacterium]|jgi:HD superfamily phosphohydrolase|nr:HD domain-containing protein [Flavobacteriales bacterium]MBK6883607.1 HD domain-containing protein [Flavobacteriales bacterium]MBK7102223.1 HD domain-containing protein [Flavobacteriales bacterium]MBK7112962.1 HD domain-containing protein [Flavobacteriales bacterium]MBK7619197.1 HD domain-containing protein [Flavobacteriales bacterium]
MKILNDPIYGFITVPHPQVLALIDHPWFQRLRYIKQLGLSHLVYPGALHTRFHHALGAMHLMGKAIDVLRTKGHAITEEEALGASIAILLHDIGHGPFSHALEHSLVEGITHEGISALVMDRLNDEFGGGLEVGIRIFRDQYPKRFLHQLVSSQLDVDRIDYLNRDSFYTGVSEGVIGGERIITMLQVVDDRLVVEEKAIYSIEKFLVARRLMYWQVYLHKTVVACEMMLVEALRRAKELALGGSPVFASPALSRFLTLHHDRGSFADPKVLNDFLKLDDHDVMGAVKVWASHPDKILATLSGDLVDRRNLRIRLQNEPWDPQRIDELKRKVADHLRIDMADTDHFVLTSSIVNNAYDPSKDRIDLLYKDGSLRDIAEASDNLGIQALAGPVTKWYLAWPRWLDD